MEFAPNIPHTEYASLPEAVLRQRAAEVGISFQNCPEPTSPAQPQIELDLIRDEILNLHDEIRNHFGAALQKAIRIGSHLSVVQEALKHERGYEDWIKDNLPFSERSARDYVLLHLHQRELIENKATRDQLSIRAALKLVRDSARAAKASTPEVCPPKIDESPADKAINTPRQILIIEAESQRIAQIVSALQATKQTSKDVRYLHFRISTPRPTLWIARLKLVLATGWQKLPALKKYLGLAPNRPERRDERFATEQQ